MVRVSKDTRTIIGKSMYLKMQVVPNLKGKTVEKFANKHISKGSKIQSDAYRSYRKPLAIDYLHKFKKFDASDKFLHWLHIASRLPDGLPHSQEELQ